MSSSLFQKTWRIFYSFPALLVLCTLVFCSVTASAEEEIRYVSDVLIINLKTAVEAPFEVVTQLYSNDRLQLLETEGRFSKVQTEDGKQGWIASQYLTRKTPKTIIIEELRSQLNALSTAGENNEAPAEMIRELENLKQLNDDLQDINSSLSAENESLTDLVEGLNQQVEQLSSTSPANDSNSGEKETISQLNAENKLLLKQIEELSIANQGLQNSVERISSDKNLKDLKTRSDTLMQENRNLRSELKHLEKERMIYWFIAGAIVFLSGMLSGKIFGKKTRKLGY